MDEGEWIVFRSYGDIGSAEVIKRKLEGENVPAMIQSTALDGGVEGEFSVLVPERLAHRARWILNQMGMSDAELDFLATGNLPNSESK